MFRSCLYCDTPFGGNDSIEHLQVGQRLAFDGKRGRLWVVCRGCGRWNLTAMDERWEAIEECERAFRDTRVRMSTDQIGLARLAGGLDLVRIGKPLLPEFAAWRYGEQLIRRDRFRIPVKAARAAALPALLLGAPLAAGLLGPVGLLAYVGAAAGAGAYRAIIRPALSIRLPAGDTIELAHEQVLRAELIRPRDEPEQWALWVEHNLPRSPVERIRRRLHPVESPTLLSGAAGRIAASRILPYLNPLGGNAATVTEAVHWLIAGGGPERAFRTFAHSRVVRPPLDGIDRGLSTLHPEVRLALEIGLHEEEERRLLAGELSILRWAWEREENLATIMDEEIAAG